MKKIANIVLNDFTNDSRVWKTSDSLNNLGFHSIVVALHSGKLLQKENIQGVDVERIRLATRPLPKWKPVQIIKYLEFICRAFWRFRSVKYFHCNDLNALPVGLLVKLFGKDVFVVYDCHEHETETNGLKGIEKIFKKWMEQFLIRFVDEVITVSDSISQDYERIYDIPKPRVVLNCPAYQVSGVSDLFRKNLGIRSNQTIFLYQGALSKGRGIEMLLEAFQGFNSDENVIVFMGYGPLEDLIRKKSNNSTVVFFHPAVPPNILLDYTKSADYGVCFIQGSCLSYRYCLPNKVFEYLMAGLPVLASDLVELKRLVESEGVGVVANDSSVDGIRNAVVGSLNLDYAEVQKNVFKCRRKYCWEEQEKVLREVYDAV